ncbi:MAG: sugar ABC transporter permease [Anaerolineales bacterium]|nr:sugar ABC transporter permease [Anaerolineales bacterium]MCA9971983.1 sugar ABC transporter permease [Anaerolineales bacterium]
MSAAAAPKPKKQTSDLAKREARLAYYLLIPTFVILFVIAFYPLGTVFYNSLTNRVFASGQEEEFVGGENFANLLSITLRQLEPELDESGNPVIDPDTGDTVYQPAVRVLPREPRRYRELSQFSLFGSRYVLGATDPEFIRSIGDTLRFTFISVAIETVLGLGIALVVNMKFPGRGAMRVVMLVPWVIPTAVSSRIWEWMFASTRVGLINVVFQRLGMGDGQIPFLASETWQVPAMIIIDVWKTTPFMALLFLAGLQLISKDLYEAADVDGAGKLRQFWSVTLPLLRPTIAVALVFRTLDAVRVFDLFQIVLAQKRYSMASYAYYELINGQRMGYSSAASVVIFVVITFFAIGYIRLLGVDND